MRLRDYQVSAVRQTVKTLTTKNNTLGVAPTGAGKTIILSAVIAYMIDKGLAKKVLVIAHRHELTDQNYQKYAAVAGHSTGFYTAKKKSWDNEVTFAMVQTLSREQTLEQMPVFDLIVFDEAHHAKATSYVRIFEMAREKNPDCKFFGVTATPNRGDRKSLKPIFDNVAFVIPISDLIADGHLCPPRTFVMADARLNLKELRRKRGEFDMTQAAALINRTPINEAVVEKWQTLAIRRQTIVFCCTVQHAIDVAASFNACGFKADWVDGDNSSLGLKRRKRVLHDHATGKLQILVNVFVLTEGYDDPSTSCIILLRPSSLKGTYIQMIGRGLRIKDGKADCFILDFGNSSIIHGKLENDIKLEGKNSNRDDKKPDADGFEAIQCPTCETYLHHTMTICPICDTKLTSQKESINGTATANEFNMVEIKDVRTHGSPHHWMHIQVKEGYNDIEYDYYVCHKQEGSVIIQKRDVYRHDADKKSIKHTYFTIGVAQKNEGITRVTVRKVITEAFEAADNHLAALEVVNETRFPPWHSDDITQPQLRYIVQLLTNKKLIVKSKDLSLLTKYEAMCVQDAAYHHYLMNNLSNRFML